MTSKEILEIVENHYSVSDFAYGIWNEAEDVEFTEEQQKSIDNAKESTWELKERYILQNLGLGEVEEVDQYGGEGQGETWYSVKYFKDHDVYIRTDGYYQSYNGTDFEKGYGVEVRPKEKVITVYEA